MTNEPTRPIGAEGRPSVGRLCLGLLAGFCLLLLLRNAEIALRYCTEGLRLCAVTVIPALFPCLVLSEIVVSSGVGARLLRPVARPLSGLFRLPPEGACAMLLGMLCGAPVGARAAVSAYDRGALTREQTERIVAVSTCPSAAFLLGAVGTSMHGDRRYGAILLAVTLATSLLLAVLTARSAADDGDLAAPRAPVPCIPKGGTLRLLTDAVGQARTAMLNVTAYVIFFSAFCGTLASCAAQWGLSAPLRAALFCLFELSNGASAAAALSDPAASAFLTALAVGWSGLSVHGQVLSVCEGRGLRMGRYLARKALHGLMTAAVFTAVLRLCPSLSRETVSTIPAVAQSVGIPVATVCFLFSLLFFRGKRPRGA